MRKILGGMTITILLGGVSITALGSTSAIASQRSQLQERQLKRYKAFWNDRIFPQLTELETIERRLIDNLSKDLSSSRLSNASKQILDQKLKLLESTLTLFQTRPTISGTRLDDDVAYAYTQWLNAQYKIFSCFRFSRDPDRCQPPRPTDPDGLKTLRDRVDTSLEILDTWIEG